MERIFDANVTVFTLKSDGKSDAVWNSKKSGGLKVNLNLYGGHFSYIKNVNAFAKSFKCLTCETFFSQASDVKRHNCDVEHATRFTFSTGTFAAPPTVWDTVEKATEIRVPKRLRSYPYWMTYDIEAVLLKDRLPSATATTTFHSEHQLVSISRCSNVPGYTEPVCFVRETSVDECKERFVRYAEEVATRAECLLQPVYKNLLAKVSKSVKDRGEAKKEFEKEKFSNKKTYESPAELCGLMGKIGMWLRQVPLVGFNSQRYDLNVMKAALIKCFCQLSEDGGKEETSI